MNPKEFFAHLFGGGRFEELIGEISLGSAADEDMTPEAREKIQIERVKTLAVNLQKRLNPFVEGNIKDFEDDAKRLVEELKGEPHGVELLNAIGYIYDQEGRKHLGGIFGFAADFSGKAHTFVETVSAVKVRNGCFTS